MAERCGAKTRKGSPCAHEAGWGTSHPGVGKCRRHGGSSPQAELSGLVQLARREQQVMGAPLSIEPHDAILECIRISAGEVAYASERVSDIEAGEAVRDGAVHVWIQVRRSAMDRLVQYSFAALKAGIEERLVKVAEQQGMLLAQAIQGILRELGVDQKPEAPAVVRKHLALVSGAP